MEPFALIVIVGGIAIAASLIGGKDWKEAAEKLGLEYGGTLQRTLSGTIDGYEVKVVQQKHHIDIKVTGRSSKKAIKSSITLSKEGFLSGVLGGRDIEIGCPEFDARTYVSNDWRSSEAEICALLDRNTRRMVTRYVVREGAKVSDGTITHAKGNSIGNVPDLVKGFIALAGHLRITASEIPARLASNALEDPVSSVRLRNLTLLQEQFRASEEAAATSAALLTDSHPSIRLAAAMFVGADGLPVVREVAQSQRIMDDVRIKAIQHLERQVEPEEMIEIANSLLSEKDARLQRIGIRSLGRLQHRPSLEAIIARLDTQDVPTVLEIVKAIENIGDSSAEAALVGLLDDPTNRIRTAAIEALAKVGTVTAVEPLHQLSKRLGFKRSARVAIESIQSRLVNAEAGRLSLAPTVDPDGALSLAEDPEKAGGLSLGESDD